MAFSMPAETDEGLLEVSQACRDLGEMETVEQGRIHGV